MGRLQPLCHKTKSCKYHAAGRCKKGPACTFAHGVGELLPRPPVLQNKSGKQEQQPSPGQSGAEPLGLPASPSGTLAGHSTIPHGLNLEAPPSLGAPGVQVVPGAPGIFGVGQLHPPPPGPCPAVSSGLGPAGLPPPLGSGARPQASGAGEQQRSLLGLGLGLGLGLVPVAEAAGDSQMAVPTNNGSVSDEGSEGPLTDDDENPDERTTGDGDPNKGRTRLNKFHKTQLCMFHQMGKCKKRTSCRFAHGPDELRPVPDLYRTKLCPTMLEMGQCSDAECRFAHSAEELRNFEAQDLAAAELAAGRPFLAPGGPAQALEQGQLGPEAHSRQAAMPPSQAPPPVSCPCGPCNVGMACGGAAWFPPGSSAVSEAPLPSLGLGSDGLCPPLGVMSSKLCPALLSLGRCVAGPSCIFAHSIDQVRPIPAPQAATKRPSPAMQVPGGCGGPAAAFSPQVLQAFPHGRALHSDFTSFNPGKSDQAGCNTFSRASLGEGNQLARLGDESASLPQAHPLEPKVPRLRVKNTFLTVQESSAAASWPRSRTLPVPSVPEENFGRLPVHVFPTASCAGTPSLGQPEAREPSGQRMADGHLLEDQRVQDGMLAYQRHLDEWPFQSATRVPVSTAPSNCHPTAVAEMPDMAAALPPDAAPEPRVPRLRVKNTFLTIQDSSDASQPPRSRTLPIPSIFENGEGPEANGNKLDLDGQRPSSTSPVNIDTTAQRLLQAGFADHAQAGLDIARVPLPHRQSELSEFLPGCGHRNLRVSSEHLGAGAARGGNRLNSTSDAAAAAGLAPSLSQSRLPSSAVLPGCGPLEQAFPGSIGSGRLDSFHRTDANRRLTEALCPEPPLLKSDRSFLGHGQDFDLDLWALRQNAQLDHLGPIGSRVAGTAADPLDATEPPFETPAASEPRVPRLRVKNTFLTVQDTSGPSSTLPPRSRTLPIPSIFEAERTSDLSKGFASLPVRPPRPPEDQGLQESETIQGSLRPGTGNAASEKLLQDLPLELDELHGDCGLPSYLASDLMVLPHQDQFAELDGWPLSSNLSKEQWEAQGDAVAGPLTAPGTLSGVGGGQEGEAELVADQLGRERRVPRLRVKNTFLTVQESAVEMQPRSRTLPVSSIFESEESSQGELERRPASVSGHLELQSTGEDGQALLESQAPWGGLERLNHFALPGSGGDRSSSSLASSRLEGLEMEGVEGEASDGGLGQALQGDPEARPPEDDLSPSQETTVRRLRVKNTFLTVDDPAKEALVPRSRTLPVPQQGETAGPPGETQVPTNSLDPGSAGVPSPSTSSTSGGGLNTEGGSSLQFGRTARVLTKKRSLLPKIGEGDQGTGCSDAQDL